MQYVAQNSLLHSHLDFFLKTWEPLAMNTVSGSIRTYPTWKKGDPQQTVQIQVLSPNLALQSQQQPKYQMQIPIQGFQQSGAVLTVAYSPDVNDGIQILGNTLPEGIQVLAALPQEMQLVQQAQTAQSHDKDQNSQTVPQVFIQNQQIIINNSDEKINTNNNNDEIPISSRIIIKEECDEMTNDEESSQGAESTCESAVWHNADGGDIVSYMNKVPPQPCSMLPVSLQQFLKLNPAEVKDDEDSRGDDLTEAIIDEDGSVRIKKKKKYKKKPPRPARPKPGQVLISSAEDGSPLYGCPECPNAYPQKEQLELHLTVHKIERRFICGICGAGLKRKEHLERHKLGHNPERPYVCSVCRKGFKRREHLNLHTVIHSGVKTEVCLECGKGFYRKDHLRKHTRSHETKRAKEEAMNAGGGGATGAGSAEIVTSNQKPTIDTILPEITIHVPTSANIQVPVQINIPQNVLTTLQAQHEQAQHSQLDALLAQHT
ncbi:Zinc finger protein 92 homolog [Eumeta japonica]|uniref:Zinc finger protein 92 homolog n=1 Tax=Eumeta variegata TaxID=151549 RepID=A0A4C1ZPY5_EUMVA|nr:Zinc finger protein 92 homolog [Eumeta japonica]